MLDGLRARYRAALRRARRVERREFREFRRWLEHTSNLLHLSILLVVPLLIASVTAISNAEELLPFVLFPPLASGTFTLFADPEGRYGSPVKFVGGLTTGAVCGSVAVWVAMETALRDPFGATTLAVSPVAAALAIFLTGAVTWAFDFEEPSAFSTALLALIAPVFSDPGDVGAFAAQYAGSVFLASTVVAVAFYVWREEFYEERSRYLYQSTKGDDHVLVPMRGDRADETALFGARLAAAHEAGKVVLLDLVDEADLDSETDVAGEAETLTDADRDDATLDDAELDTAETGPVDPAESNDADHAEADADEPTAAARRLEAAAARVRTRVGVPCEVVVAADGSAPARTVLETARETNCDLVVTPYEERNGGLSPFVRGLFRGRIDTVAFRPEPGSPTHEEWKRVMVPVRRAGDTAHAMIDFARRLAGRSGNVSVCTCIDSDAERRAAETMLANLVETFEGSFETRVSTADIEPFLATNDDQYDLTIVGASTDRSTASRFVSPPTFERLRGLDCDVAIFHRG